jgi:hypothetical protein
MARQTKENRGGRPTAWSRDVEKKAYWYIENHLEVGDTIPSIAGLAYFLGRTRETLYQWAKDEKKLFSDILDRLMMRQQTLLLSNGLTGAYNSTIAKLILTKHGYSDRQEISGPEGAPIEHRLTEMTDDEVMAMLAGARERADKERTRSNR